MGSSPASRGGGTLEPPSTDTTPAVLTIDETFDVGIDTRTGVDTHYEPHFRFTGKLGKLRIELRTLSEKMARQLRQKSRQARNAAQ